MSDKSKKFNPSTGWIVAINEQVVSVIRLSTTLKIDPVELGRALEESGYMLTPDPMDFSADTWKVIEKSLTKKETE